MDQNEIIKILERHLFTQEKIALLQSISKYPDRFVGVFRSTSPRLKLLQNVLQSREIRFGDALEEIINKLIPVMGFETLPTRFSTDNKDYLSCDQYFCDLEHKNYYLMEQKVRDDHDSTKKRGQVENFRQKLIHLKALHGHTLIGIMYFIDPALRKNANYYRLQLERLRVELEIQILLFYNGELFQYLEGHTRTWDLLLNTLKFWRHSTPEYISLDYEADLQNSYQEITMVSGLVWHKLIANQALWENGVFYVLFPSGQLLNLLADEFQNFGVRKIRTGVHSITYADLAVALKERLRQFYNMQS